MKHPEKGATVKERIATVLMENENGYLTAEQIAELSWRDAYIWDTRKALNEKVRRNIHGAAAILVDRGFVVIGKKNLAVKGNPFDRWKVAGDEDRDDVIKVLGERRNRADGFKDASKALDNNAKEQGLLPEEKQRLTS